MLQEKERILKDIRRFELLAQKYTSIQAASTELINLQAISNLPKGTEHFISDLHGEYETFQHIINNASGAIREKVNKLYRNTMTREERATLSTIIYYPVEKLNEILSEGLATKEWYKITLNRLIEVCRLVASKYTRSKVRKALPVDFAYIIEELLHNSYTDHNKTYYYENIIDTIIEIDRADAFIKALCNTIKRLIVDHLHIVGDIFDRGARPDLILETLMDYHSLDIQWGNHDIAWMGAASGSRACIAGVLMSALSYNNLKFLEQGYGINLRPLALFAEDTYGNSDVSCFEPKTSSQGNLSQRSINLLARMKKAVAVMMFKLEGQVVKRNLWFSMADRILLDKIDYEKGTIEIECREYKLKDRNFPTIDKNDPYRLTEEESELMEQLKSAFLHSEKLQRHVRFLYTNGSIYSCYNSNLLFHGCIPMNDDGSFMKFKIGGVELCGKEFLDYADVLVRQGYYGTEHCTNKQLGKDFMWFLWCGKDSPLFGKKKITTFERILIEDPQTWKEPKNAYYKYSNREEVCISILKIFGLPSEYSHIINGHVPVKFKDGESSVRANGKLIVIDGGFCRAYRPTTGIAGYTLIYNSYGIKLCFHEPFEGTQKAIKNNTDIFSTSVVSEKAVQRMRVKETDKGREILDTIDDLKLLLSAYRLGLIKESKE